MPRVTDLFDIVSARSDPFDDHREGPVAFITNGCRDNGILGHVTPLKADRVFKLPCICVSAFCEATVPNPPFIARGNGGSSLTVLVPKEEMTTEELWGYATFLSLQHGWKFSFGRMASSSRIAALTIPADAPTVEECDPRTLLPKAKAVRTKQPKPLEFKLLPLNELFRIESGDYHSVEELRSGDVPLISCGALDNGIIGFYNPSPETIYKHLLTVAYNGDYPLMAKYHPYSFAAKDDVAVLHPHLPMPLETTLFVQLMLNREVWRHSYGRKLYRARLEKFGINVPVKSGDKIDHAGIASWLEQNPLWTDVSETLRTGVAKLRKAALALTSETSIH